MSHGTVKKSNSNAKNGGNGNGHAPSPTYDSQTLAPPPDGGWGWVVVFASFMVHVITDGMTYSFGVFYSEFLTYFKEGKGTTAWIVSILVGVTLSSGPISSSFVNRWGCRVVTVAGAILASVCVTLSAFANNVFTLILTIGVGTGFGFGLIYLPAIVSVTVWFEKRRSLATGIAVCGSGLGTLMFAPITSSLIDYYGWRGAMFIIGALTLNCIPLGIMFRPVPELPRSAVQEPMLAQNNKIPLIRSQSSENVVKSNGKSRSEDNDVARLTLSQPALNDPQENRSRTPSRQNSGIMLRPDVLYQGSMKSLTNFKSSSVNISKIRRHTIDNAEQRCQWLPCSTEFKTALSEMLDFSLFVDPIFIIFAVSNFLTSVGFYIPYVYVVPMSKNMGIDNSEYLISIIGAANLVGRIILGFISDMPWVNRLLAYNVCLTIAGTSTALAMVCWEFWGLAIYATVFGFTIGAYVGLTSVVLVDLLGLERLTNAFGLLLLFQGIASLIGPPFAGWLYDNMQTYAPGFYVAGGAIALSGIILFSIPIFERRQNREEYEETQLEEI